LKASSNSSINVAVPSGDSAAKSYILTQFTQEYLSPNDVSLNDLSKEEILMLTSNPIRMEEEVPAQEPIALKKAIAPQSRTRQTKAVATNTTVDPFVGKGVAFGCNSDFRKTLIKDFGKKWVPDAVCYHLDGKAGHVVGTVMRKSRGLGKRNGNETNYDVVWEFSALAETNVPYSYLLEGNKEADGLMMCRKKLQVEGKEEKQ